MSLPPPRPKKFAYLQFLKRKIPQAEVAGFEPPSDCHASLFPHQRDLAQWMIRGGRRACFASFGLGKTRIHLQLAKWITEKTEGKYLIVAPLGVRQEFTQSDGPEMDLKIEFCRTTEEAFNSDCPVIITNYDSVVDGKMDVSFFAGAGLDESSVLRSFGSETYQEFLKLFKAVKYRFVFTATPSPNRYKELIHYAGFLGIMDTGEALTRFFQRDSSQANNLTLYPHMEKQFWLWLNSWAVFLQKPSDLGYSDEGYDLPKIKIHWHKIAIDHRTAWKQVDSWGQSQMFRDDAQGLKASAEVKRESIELRVLKARQIVDSEPMGKHWIIWHDLEAERDMIERKFKLAKTVYGSQDLEEREELIMGFSRGEYRILATKPVIAGSGCNFQRHCADAIFIGVGYKFNDFIQAIHRIHRFQQKKQVNIHIIYLESESAIKDALEAKWQRHEQLMATMQAILQENKLTNQTIMELIRTLGCERAEVKGDNFSAIKNDCVLETQAMPEKSVDMILTSIPFGNQYEYSPSYNDFGHNSGDDPFFQQMDFIVPELLRVLKPGRIAAIHVKDRIMFGNVTGFGGPTVNPFSDKTTALFLRHGFVLLARITIDTDVVRENNQTYRLGWSENAKDGTKMGAGMPEYVLVFRRLPTDLSNAYADDPVKKSKEEYTRADWQLDAAGLWRSNGNRLPDPDVMVHMNMDDIKRLWIEYCLSGGYSHDEHVALAKALEERGKLPASFMLFPAVSRDKDIWTDIARMRTLNTEQSRHGEEMHVCPLQLDIIKRLITRYTNPGDTVFDPFAGIFSVPFQALKMGRKAIGTELNEEYWRCGVGYCEQAENEANVPTLFDLMQTVEVK
jgi:DNA modification methylase